MEEIYIKTRDDARVYAQIYNNGHNDTLVFLHGGPGAGCDYFRYQAELLSSYVNVVIYDQRGVFRSDDIVDEENFGIDTLVSDLEEIRQQLSINKWDIIGHSFGALLALLYAVKFPHTINKLVFEGPSFDFVDSMHTTYIKITEILEKQNRHEILKEIRDIMASKSNYSEYLNKLLSVTPGDVITEVYHPKAIDKNAQRINFSHIFTEAQQERTKKHIDLILRHKKIEHNYLPLLAELEKPSLAIVGEYDTVFSKLQQEAYLQNAKGGRIIKLPGCGHTPHNEEPGLFVKTVLDFIR